MTGVPGLPPAVRQRAADLLDGRLDVVPLRDAATVLLLRDGARGLEVFMQRRTSTLVFAAGMYVFPGGRVDPQDRDPAVRFEGTPPDPVPFPLGGDFVLHRPAPSDPVAQYRALVAAAVRETVEEAGVLLAWTPAGPATSAQADRVRAALLAGVPFAGALAAIGAGIRFDRLVALSHWMTPAVEVRRFDTRFFAARLPPGQHGHSASGESDEAQWVRPAVMLEGFAAGQVVMLPPTVAALHLLADAQDAAAVLAEGHRPSLRPVLPHPYREGGDIRWRLVDGYTGLPLGSW